MTLRFGWRDHAVTVEVEDPALADTVAGLFAPLRLDGDGLDAEPSIEVSRTGRGYRLRDRGSPETGDAGRRFGSIPDVLAGLEHAVVLHLLDGRRGETHLHAAAAVLEGRTVVATGSSGAGKSSLALAWSLAGYPILSDDMVLVDEEGRVSGFPRLVKVDRRQLREHGLSPSETVAPQRSNPEVWWDPSRSGGWVVDRVAPALVARVQFRPGAVTRVTPLAEVEALRILLDNVLAGGLQPEESVDRFLEIVRSARLVDVSFGSGREAASTLWKLAALEGP